jgi:hypothetical protein
VITPPDEPTTTSANLSDEVVARENGYAQARAEQDDELVRMTDAQAWAAFDELVQLLPLGVDEPDRGSGLVEQQRLFARVRK